jgi:hypothetical protein
MRAAWTLSAHAAHDTILDVANQTRATAALLSLLLGAAACTSSDSTRAAPSAAPSARPSSHKPTEAPVSHEMVVAVTDPARKTVTLYRVDQDRQAHKLRSIARPSWADGLGGLQLSAATDPAVCLVFSALTPEYELRNDDWCYPSTQAAGVQLPLTRMVQVALSRDGRTLLAMTDVAHDGRQLLVNQLHDGTSSVTHRVALPNFNDKAAPGCDQVTGIAWAGDADVVMECIPVEDSPSNVFVQKLAALTSGAAPGAGRLLRPTGPLAKGYDWLGQVTPVDADTAVAVMLFNIPCHEGETCPSHAPWPDPNVVLVDLHTGRVLEVVATALPDRTIAAVSGGSHGLVYISEGGPRQDKRVYVRWPGEKHGSRVVGLPADFDQVIAQH